MMNAGRIVVVTGSRDWTDRETIVRALVEAGPIRLLVHGDCRGADRMAAWHAEGIGIATRAEPARWEYGVRAGPVRNEKMLRDYRPDLVLAFPSPNSRGTWDCVRKARAFGIEVRVYGPCGGA